MSIELLTYDRLNLLLDTDPIGLRDYTLEVGAEVMCLITALDQARTALTEATQRAERAEAERDMFARAIANVVVLGQDRLSKEAQGIVADLLRLDHLHDPIECACELSEVGTTPARAENLTHNEGTLRKVYDALSRAGLVEPRCIDAISDMQNHGIYFREAVREGGEWVDLSILDAACICQKTGHDYNGALVFELNADATCPVHGERTLDPAHDAIQAVALDADLADIEARTAAGRRVALAADFLADIERQRTPATEDSSIWLEARRAAVAELVAAVDARRALADQGPAAPSAVDPESLAQLFHETYERLAPDFGYRTREASAKPWAEVPEGNRGLMVATCREVLRVLDRPKIAITQPVPQETP